MVAANIAHRAFPQVRTQAFYNGKSLKRMEQESNFGCQTQAAHGPRIILRLDIAQESRSLSDTEYRLRVSLKKQILGWAALEKARRRQSSRITYLREGDANTKFFHLKANARRRKNFIQRLKMDQAGLSLTMTNR